MGGYASLRLAAMKGTFIMSHDQTKFGDTEDQ